MGIFGRIGFYLPIGIVIVLLISGFFGSSLASTSLPYILLVIFILICGIGIGIYFIFRAAGKQQPAVQDDIPQQSFEMGKTASSPPEDTKTTFSDKEISKHFREKLHYLKQILSGKTIYDIPWVMMMGETGCGKTTALKHSGVETDIAQSRAIEEDKASKKQACNWFFFEKKGIVLDIAGDLVLQENFEKSDRRSWRSLYGTETSDEKAWSHVLGLLRDYRPERPIDSLIFTIPCTDLLSDAANPPDLVKIAEKADLLYKKLRHVQKTLGVSFPIYILISECDKLEGFQSFCRQKREHGKRHEIFGWSSPYAIGRAYSSAWIHEAFRETYKTLSEEQFRLLTRDIDAADRDNLFLFPSEFQRLLEPIQAYADRLFKHSNYHESFVFRGLYFCTGTPDEADDERKQPEGFFIKDLLEKKIFPEFELSHPLTRVFLSRNRKVRFAQAAALVLLCVGSIGLWKNSQQLRYDVREMMPVFESIRKDLGNSGFNKDTPEVFEKRALNLFKGMTRIKSLRYLFILPSQFSNIHEAIRRTITTAYNEIVLKAMHSKLRQKAAKVVEPGSDIMLMTFLNNIEILEKNVGLYNSFQKSDDLKEFGKIVNYLFDIELNESLFLNNPQFHQALKQTEGWTFDPKIYQIKSSFTLEALTPAFYEELFERNNVKLSIERLSSQLGRLAQTSGYDVRFIEEIYKDITNTERITDDGKNSWIAQKQFNSEAFNKIGNSGFFKKEDYQKFKTIGNIRFENFKNELFQKRNALTQTPFLETQKNDTSNDRLKLSSDTTKLKADIKKLLGYDFMKFGKVNGRLDPKTRLMWDMRMLEKNIESFEAYKNFIKNDVDSFAVGLRNIIKNASRNSMEQKFLEMITQMPVFEKNIHLSAGRLEESDTLLEIRNFKEASKLLNKLMTHFYDLDMTSSYSFLSAIISYQSMRLLNEANTLLKSENLYDIKDKKDFLWWYDREPRPLSLVAFGAADDKELRYYLELQRNRIRHLAYEYIEPVIAFFLSNQRIDLKEDKQMMSVWSRILSELEKYDNKKPENSITALEKFILFDMNDVHVRNYLEKVKASELSDLSGDFFLQKRDDLRRMLYHRCESLTASQLYEAYGELKLFFDQKLAGRFPFAKHDADIHAEAEPEDIKDFYRIFDKIPPFKDVLKKNDIFVGQSGTKTYDFLAEMETVRQFFSAYLIPEEKDKKEDDKDKKAETKPSEKKKIPEVPVFDADVEFRINQKYETAANHIIDWRLNIGEQVFKNTGDKHTGRWQWGDPVRFTLRWAKNGTTFPISAEKSGILNTEEKTVSYELNNRWSLIRFIQQHQAEANDLDKLRDVKPHTLKFKVGTMGVSEEKPQKKFDTAAFIRLSLMAPDKGNVTLSLPSFPADAPELELKKESKSNDKNRAAYP